MKSPWRGELSFSQAIRKIKTHDFFKLKETRCLKRKNTLKKKLLFLHRLKNDEEIECPICMESIGSDDRVMTYCGHFFCFNCIQKVYNNYKHECPLCRGSLNKKKIFLIV